MGDFFYLCNMDYINDFTGIKPTIHNAIEEYAKLVTPKTIDSLKLTYMGLGCWRIDISVNQNIYNFLMKIHRGRLIKDRFQYNIEKDMLKMFPFVFDVHINLSE